MKVAVLGGTRGIGRALSQQLVARGDSVCLLGRDATTLAAAATEAGPDVSHAVCDLADARSFRPALEVADAALNGLDTVIVTAAAFATQEVLSGSAAAAREIMDIDFTQTIAFCEVARDVLAGRPGATLCVTSSVSGDRPRASVLIYGAAKAGLSYYLDGLELTAQEHGVRVVCVKPGFVHTDMTAGLEAPPFAGQPDEVAETILRGIDRGSRVIYAPPIWRWVMLAIRSIPRPLFRRLRI